MSDWTSVPGELAAWSLGSGPRVVFVHGFTQTAQAWQPIATAIAAHGHEAVIVDAPGHGDSAPLALTLPETADAMARQFGRAAYVGYSMGGRLCLHIATRHPAAVAALALISTSPGIVDPAQRALRRAADERLADHLLDVGLDTFLNEWLAQPLFAGLRLDDEQRADRLRNTPRGLASSLRLAGSGAQESLWPELLSLRMPVLSIAGERDAKYLTIARDIVDAVSDGVFESVPNAGHAVILERPAAVSDALRKWLQRVS